MFRFSSSLMFFAFYLGMNILNSGSVCARKPSDPQVHLILKNVNIPLSQNPVESSSNNKNYELVDFSVYVPKSIRQTKSVPVHDTFIKHQTHTPTTNSGLSHGYTPLKQPTANKSKAMIIETYHNNRGIPQTHRSESIGNFQKPSYFEPITSPMKPHFEALTASASSVSLPKPVFESVQVHPSPNKPKFIHGFQNTGLVTPSPNYAPTTWRPKQRITLGSQYVVNHPHIKHRGASVPQNFFIPTPASSLTTKFISPRIKSQLVTPVTTNLSPRYEPLTAPRLSVPESVIKQFKQGATRSPNTNYYDTSATHNVASPSQPKTPKISSTYTSELVYDSSTGNSNSNQNNQRTPYAGNLNSNQNNQRVRSLPKKEIIMNNVVYHEDNYAENSNQDDEHDNNSNRKGTRRNREQSGETKRIYRTMPSTTQYPPKQNRYPETKTKRRKPTHKRGVETEELRRKEMVTESSAASFENDSPELLESKRMENMIAAPAAKTNSQQETSSDYNGNEDLKNSYEQLQEEQGFNNDEKDNMERPEMDAAAQAVSDEIRYFQDIFVAQNSPSEMEFGHIMDSPDRAEERYEKNDRKNQRYQGKVKWTDKEGGYGEHYWDLGHAKPKSISSSKEENKKKK